MAQNRIRGRALQRIRSRILAHEPLCRPCAAAGRTTEATQIDHIVPLFKGGSDTADNRQPICDACHQAKTDVDLGVQRSPFNADGEPTDPMHPWNR
jgi:5-methylcytosine-specific restriction protein A